MNLAEALPDVRLYGIPGSSVYQSRATLGRVKRKIPQPYPAPGARPGPGVGRKGFLSQSVVSRFTDGT